MHVDDCYYLGKITKLHGYKGGLVFHLDTDDPAYYTNLESVLIEENGQLVPFFFDEFEHQNALKFIGKLTDVDPEKASQMVNKELYLPLASLPKLEGNKFYFHEIVNFNLLDASQNNLVVGVIKSVNDQTAQTLLEIVDEHKKTFYIPLIDDWMVSLNRKERSLSLRLPEGIHEL